MGCTCSVEPLPGTTPRAMRVHNIESSIGASVKSCIDDVNTSYLHASSMPSGFRPVSHCSRLSPLVQEFTGAVAFSNSFSVVPLAPSGCVTELPAIIGTTARTAQASDCEVKVMVVMISFQSVLDVGDAEILLSIGASSGTIVVLAAYLFIDMPSPPWPWYHTPPWCW